MAVILITTLMLALVAVQGERNWNFDNTDAVRGPSHWKDSYPGCGGKRQSPVSIKTDESEQQSELEEFVLTNYDNTVPSLTLTNNGDRVKVLVNGGKPKLSGGGLGFAYEMSQFHFHWSTNNKRGSEHKIDDDEYAGELHIGHLKQGSNAADAYADPQGIAILAVLLKAGGSEDHPAYEKIFQYLDKIENASNEYEMPSFVLRDLLPSNLHKYYRYNGSRAEPPCEEAAIWTIFHEPVTLSDNQFERLRQLKNKDKFLLHNNRPVAPLYDRKIYISWRKHSKEGVADNCNGLKVSKSFIITVVIMAFLKQLT
ncbi:hypothetical protein LSH36_3g05054 [Paralvinella palmiformis]|uniref:carbonic anhydrase n=1 Tax=Paralvinella palmiformis TaxID=53620 RepID=A0AAD9KGS0_9ANNE|nr:hypothetical protein LSH36_3g05054 [Paralvinella palmiformis]